MKPIEPTSAGRQKRSAAHSLKRFFSHTAVRLTGILLIGLLLGLASGYLVWGRQSHTKGTQRTQGSSALERRRDQRAGDQLTRARSMIQRDLADKKLTQAQADTINAKIDEMRTYLEQADRSTKEGREAIRRQREQWRMWAKENNIPLKYVLLMY